MLLGMAVTFSLTAGAGADGIPDEMKAQGYSVKISLGEYEYAIFTAKGENARLDKFYLEDDGSYSQSVYICQNTGKNRHGYRYDSEWEELDPSRAAQSTNQFFVHYVQDASELYCEKGYSKTGTAVIAGKDCDVYSGTLSVNGTRGFSNYMELGKNGVSGEFAVWNGLTLKTVCEKAVQSLCTAVTVGNIPDSAFTKTLNTDWIR